MLRPWTEDLLENLRRTNAWYHHDGRAYGAAAGDMDAVRPFGVNVCGYLRDESGWGAAGRGYLHALRTLSIPLALRDMSGLSSNRSEDPSIADFDVEHPYDINLVCVDAGQHFAMMAEV